MHAPMPHLTLLFDIDPQAVIDRILNRGLFDKYDNYDLGIKNQIRGAFLLLQKLNHHRIKTINANQDLQTVTQDCIEVIKLKLQSLI